MAQNKPIMSDIKGNRLDMNELIYSASWAYMRELRENNKTKKIYPVNPYAEVYRFRPNMYGIFAQNIDGGGDSWIYIITGPKKAMLIDTGFGLGDLKGLVNEITGGVPLVVVNTHPHPDHALGNFQFDKVYCHEYAVLHLESMRIPSIWDTMAEKLFDANGKCIYVEFDKNDIQPYKYYEIIGCPDGHIFNLGEDYDIELIHLGGHAAGQAALLDKKGRTLFPGDDILTMRVSVGARPADPFAKYATVTAFRDRLEKLSERLGEFDGIFPGHFIVDLESRVVLDMLDTCNAIIANPDNYDYTEERQQGLTLCKTVKGLGVIGYKYESV